MNKFSKVRRWVFGLKPLVPRQEPLIGVLVASSVISYVFKAPLLVCAFIGCGAFYFGCWVSDHGHKKSKEGRLYLSEPPLVCGDLTQEDFAAGRKVSVSSVVVEQRLEGGRHE